jgi:hypothetical protein
MDEMTEHLLHAIEKLAHAVHAMLSTGVVHDPRTHQLVRDAEQHLLAARKLSKKPADPLPTFIFAPPPTTVPFVPPAGQVVVGKPAA